MWSLQRSGDAEPGLHELHHHATHEHEEWKERCRQSGCKTHKATILKQFDPKDDPRCRADMAACQTLFHIEFTMTLKPRRKPAL